MYNYKWFRCFGIDDGKVETRNVKVETGRAERVKPRTLCKTNPQRVRHPAGCEATLCDQRKFESSGIRHPGRQPEWKDIDRARSTS